MPLRHARLLVLMLPALPTVLGSFYFACPEYHVPPRVRAHAYAKEHLPSRTASWSMPEYMPETPPTRAIRVIGEVEVLARGNSTTLRDLHNKAKEAAEKMGGDALVDVSWRDAGATKPKVGERGMYVLTAKVARWQDSTGPPLVGS